MSISKEKGQYYQAKWEEMEYRFANVEMKQEIERLQQENKQLKEALLDIKELQDNYLEEIYKGNVDLRLASSTLCKIDNIVNKASGDKENES